LIGEVGRRVAELRAARGLTQAALAERIGIGAKHLQRIELGELNLTLMSIARIAGALDVEPFELLVSPSHRRARRGRPPKPSRTGVDDPESD
jgi:transcriptional regulator with XRE-family HTH domain